jgi:hypothetical protein
MVKIRWIIGSEEKEKARLEILDKIPSGIKLEGVDEEWDYEGPICVVGKCKKEQIPNLLELVQSLSKELKQRHELTFHSTDEPFVSYYRYGKTGRLLTENLKKTIEFSTPKKRKNSKSKIYVSWMDKPKLKGEFGDDEVLQKIKQKNADLKFAYDVRTEQEEYWLWDLFTMTPEVVV